MHSVKIISAVTTPDLHNPLNPFNPVHPRPIKILVSKIKNGGTASAGTKNGGTASAGYTSHPRAIKSS
ncbi:MAG TPA: hypothetical protein PLZ48_04380 [Candidatus Cloacimonas sp.]|nr:hypothetical protein [Candidatus Cloacimonas sp.]